MVETAPTDVERYRVSDDVMTTLQDAYKIATDGDGDPSVAKRQSFATIALYSFE